MKDNDVEMYSTHNEGKSVVAERFIRTLKNKYYKYMTSIPKNVYIDNLADIVNKYNNTHHSTIKRKPFDVKPRTYIDFNKENTKEEPKLEVGDHVRISKYENIFAKGYIPNWDQEVFEIKQSKTLFRVHAISDLNSKETAGTFCRNKLQKTNQQQYGVEKLIKRKDDNYMLNGKIMIIPLTVELIKKT